MTQLSMPKPSLMTPFTPDRPRQSPSSIRWVWMLILLVVAGQIQAADTAKPKLILDCDTANEIDDLYAIVRMLHQDQFQVLGLTSTQWLHYLGDPDSVQASQRMNEELLRRMRRDDLPTPMGSEEPMGKPWGGTDPKDSPACQFIIEQARSIPDDKSLIVVCTGATTNLASAIRMAPEIAPKIKCYCMGFRYDESTGAWNKSEFNVRRDLNAADFLLSHPEVEMHVMTATLSQAYKFDQKDSFRRQSQMGPVGAYLTEAWTRRFPDSQKWVMWDLALVEAMLHPEMANEKQVPGPPENGGRPIWVYDRIDVDAMRDDFWNTVQRLGYDGTWSFHLSDGYPVWLDIRTNDLQTPTGSLLWSVGSAGPIQKTRWTDDGSLAFVRKRKWKPGGADVAYELVGDLIAKLNDDDSMTLTFTQRVAGDDSSPTETVRLSGKRIPLMPSKPDLAKVEFGEPIDLLSGNDLSGWSLIPAGKQNGWRAVDGVLINETPKQDFSAYGVFGNLVTDQKFNDFRLELEYNVPAGGNSGVYLRGTYEAQVVDRDSKMQGISGPGAIFGRIAPSTNAGKPGGQWNQYVLTLVDRHITVQLNGITVIDNEPLAGCTGGGIESDDTAPGPILLQGDHTSVKYRKLRLYPVVQKD
ncbi:family 16 glycoside hydrolase [Crateriforma conspicua]|uniref:Ribonucleoside hydrolase RihC n=1 Tax=Crateriforma conspicua TaxID=2527996 RepID=A0A5C5XYK3_9PLAN|nr:family 16 glycoside hydrolase [Crateriforma conspicua]TWT68467.1 ribonucleoside hydrolase RihC [Crateriforma conspicua]